MIHKQPFDLYAASCTSNGGIYHYRISDDAVHTISCTPLDKPMYMVIAQNRLYSLLRTAGNWGESALVICQLDGIGVPWPVGKLLSTKGEIACHLCVNQGEIYATNYASGSVIRFPDLLVKHNGSSIHRERQASPHPHYVTASPDGDNLLVADLGLDQILIYDKDLLLQSTVSLPAGSGPRHLAISEDGKHIFCANELSSTVSVLYYEYGTLTLGQTVSTLPLGFSGESTVSAIRCVKDKVYVANRGHDSIAELQFTDHRLMPKRFLPVGGQCPRDFCICDNLLITANQQSNNLSITRLEDGEVLSQIEIDTPVCVLVR